MAKLYHVLESQQFSRRWIERKLFPLARKMETIIRNGEIKDYLAGKRMVTFFYEPSTRTRASFEMAMDRLGGKVVFSTENAKEFSSVAKGETIEDSIRVLCGYHPDIFVLRTNEEGMAKRAAAVSTVPIINAGDGAGQHPTQALLDLYTVKKETGRISGTWMAMCGDLCKGRTVRSLAYLYAKFPNVKISFVSPEAARMRQDIKDYLKRHNVWFEEIYDLREVAGKVDIVYSTRIQRERGGDVLLRYGPPSFWTVNQEVLDMMKKDAIIMHPQPIKEEIDRAVADKDRRAAYFRQAENGFGIRMALLKIILNP